jgi:osmoprotectant transport system permease protein
MLAGALLVVVITLLLELLLAACQRVATARFGRPGSRAPRFRAPGSRTADGESSAPLPTTSTIHREEARS